MFISEAFGDPDYNLGFQTGQIGEDLTQVLQVGEFKLILDKYTVVSLRNARYNVRPIRPDVNFLAFQFQF